MKLLTIVGPTASGKSDLAMQLAQKFDGEIIAADSRTLYRYMDIGTAKPTHDEMLLISHHLVDIADPNERVSASQFKGMAEEAIKDISERGKLPILVGGSGMYIDSVLFDYRFPSEADEGLRDALEGLTDDELIARLEAVDDETARTIDRANRRRVIRAIETAGQPKSKSHELRADTLVLGIQLDKNILQTRIEQRIEKMLEKGFIQEVKQIGDKFGWDCEAFSAIGYRAFRDVARGTKSIDEGRQDFVRGDMQLAKKQMTWFKRNADIVWLDGGGAEMGLKAEGLVSEFLGD